MKYTVYSAERGYCSLVEDEKTLIYDWYEPGSRDYKKYGFQLEVFHNKGEWSTATPLPIIAEFETYPEAEKWFKGRYFEELI